MPDGELKAHLVVALSRAAVGDGVRALLDGDVHETLGDAGAGGAGAEKIFLIHSPGLHGGDDVVVHIIVCQVEHIQLRRACPEGFFLKPLQLVGLADVAGHRDDLAVVVILLQPGNDDGRIKAAGIGQDDLFDIRHGSFPPFVFVSEWILRH